MAAEDVTPETMAFFLEHTSGVICVPLESARADELELPLMVRRQHRGPAHRVHRDGRLPPRHDDGHLRARPRRDGARAGRPGDPAGRPRPARATSSPCATAPGGVLKRAGHTEAAVDLRAWPGKYPGGGALRDRDRRQVRHGAAARARGVRRRRHGLPIVSIADLIRYRRQHEKLVRRVAEATLPDRARATFTGLRLRVGARRRAAPGARLRRRRRARRRAGARALRVPDRRRHRLAALRLRPAARTPRSPRSPRRAGRRGLPARPRGPRHRPRPQDPGVRAAGGRARHRRRQPRARAAGRQARVRHRRADPGRPRA